ncbi:MAG: hypothetical protein AAFU71_08565 [Cyanobacteria bacterium J06632_22]
MPDATPDSNNPFIGNPFMKGGMEGVRAKSTPSEAEGSVQPSQNRSPQNRSPQNRSISTAPGRGAGPAKASPEQGPQGRGRTGRPRLTLGRDDSAAPPATDVIPRGRSRQRPYAESAELETGPSKPPSRATQSVNGKTSKASEKNTDPAETDQSSQRSSAKSGQRSTKRSTGKAKAGKAKIQSAAGRSQTPKSKRAAAPSEPRAFSAPAVPSGGYKVQVIAKIPVSNNTNLPGRDYLWFADYPVIPRVGDCLFQNGMYFRVDAVFLYENNRPGWCADVEVSYYSRRR